MMENFLKQYGVAYEEKEPKIVHSPLNKQQAKRKAKARKRAQLKKRQQR